MTGIAIIAPFPSPDRFYALQSQVTRFRGQESGHAHAEGYIRHAQSPGNLLP